MNFRGWKASITDLGKLQKKLSECNLQERQFSTSSIPYGECIATLFVGAPYRADAVCSERADCHGFRVIEEA